MTRRGAIKVVGYDDATGYGVAARANVAALRGAGTEVLWCPLAPAVHRGDPLDRMAAEPAHRGYDAVVLHVVPEYYPALMGRERRADPQRPVWGYTVWETDRLPAHWPAILNRLDGLFVPSEWNLQVCRAAGVTVPIAVFPHVASFGEAAESGAQPPAALAGLEGRFIFYTISMWTERKAPWYALRAFLSAFSADDPVAFVLKTEGLDRTRTVRPWRSGFRRRHPAVAEAFARELAAFPQAPPVRLLDQPLDDAGMGALHRACHGYMALSRAEGWGLGAYEAAWAGNPVIATAFGGHLCYLPADWPGLVSCRLVPVRAARHEASYTPDQTWAEPDLDQAASLAREFAGSPERARELGRTLQRHVSTHFSTSSIVGACLEALRR
jgi:glycosyltransferase involved in cell wall biosynthesis